jgi:hypothetical protein
MLAIFDIDVLIDVVENYVGHFNEMSLGYACKLLCVLSTAHTYCILYSKYTLLQMHSQAF